MTTAAGIKKILSRVSQLLRAESNRSADPAAQNPVEAPTALKVREGSEQANSLQH